MFCSLCSVTVAASALLIFLLEPMFAKMALPLLGGAANVWIAAMMFYQIALLIGYLYAHLLSRAPSRCWRCPSPFPPVGPRPPTPIRLPRCFS